MTDVITRPEDQSPLPPDDEVERLRAEVVQLQEALLSRATIEQAKGVLMAQLNCDADAAFAELTRRSQAANVKLRDIAAGLLREVTDS